MILWASALPRKFRLHDTRHTTATLLLAAGVDLYVVARILRHTDPRLTFKTYAHLVPGYLHAQIDRFPAAPPKPAALVLQEGKSTEIAAAAIRKTSGQSRVFSWSRQPELNRRPTVYETVALPTELCRPARARF